MAIITKEELAERLDFTPYGASIFSSRAERQEAIDSGLCVITGNGDDILDFDGSLYDEVDAFEGGTFYLMPNGVVKKRDKDGSGIKIVAEWCPKDTEASWRISVSVPATTFKIVKDDELFCIGCVIEFSPAK